MFMGSCVHAWVWFGLAWYGLTECTVHVHRQAISSRCPSLRSVHSRVLLPVWDQNLTRL